MAILEQSKPTVSWKWYILVPVILAVVTCITYWPSLTYQFQFDDIYNIKKFFHLRFQPIKDFAFGGGRWISYALNTIHYKMGEFEPFVYRRSNVIFHTITGILIFFVTLFSLSGLKTHTYFAKRAFSIALVTALLFLLHPVQTQTVSYIIQGQLEGLASLFVMAIILCYLFYRTTHSIPSKIILGILIAALGILSCGTKEIAILSPLLLIVIDWFFISQGSLAQLKKQIPFFVGYTILIAVQYVRYLNFPFLKNSFLGNATLPNNVGNVITNAGQTINPYTYFISQFKVILHYIGIFLWPFNLSVDYDWKMATSFFTTDCILSLCGILALLGITAFLLFKDKINPLAFGSLWFFIGLAPRSTIIPSTELITDYKTYFSAFGIIFLLAVGLIALFEFLTKKLHIKNPKTLSIAFMTFGSLLLCIGTYERNKVWRSSEEFWLNIVQNSPKKARGYNNYAVAVAEQKRYDEAIPYLRKAIKMDPHYPDPWSNISVCYSSIGKIDVAIDCLRRAININPHYPEFYNNLASYVLQKGNYEETKKLAQQAIKLRPYYGKAYFNWGQALFQEGNKPEAFEKIKYSCLNADYDIAMTFKTYAELAVELHKYEDALIGYTHLSKLEPHNKDAFFNVGNAYYYLNRYDEAEKIYLTLVQQDPTEYRSWLNLAEVHLKKGNVKQAALYYEKALPMQSYFPEVVTRLAECKKIAETTRA